MERGLVGCPARVVGSIRATTQDIALYKTAIEVTPAPPTPSLPLDFEMNQRSVHRPLYLLNQYASLLCSALPPLPHLPWEVFASGPLHTVLLTLAYVGVSFTASLRGCEVVW